MRKLILTTTFWFAAMAILLAQNPTPFSCSGSDGFGYYMSSATETNGPNNTLTYSSSRLSKIVTNTGSRTTLCDASTIGVALNGLAFNPHDNYLYGVSRYDASQFSGKLYRIGENCQKIEIPVTGAIQKFTTNNTSTIDAAGGNIGSGTFDLDNNYYVNTSYTNQGSTGFTNKIQKIRITESGAVVQSTKTLTCASCSGEVQVTDIIFDEATSSLIGSNFINKRLYKINTATGVMTPFAATTTGLTSPVLGMYKNRDGQVRAITANGKLYSVNVTSGAFTEISTINNFISQNADAASGCYAPPSISGHLFYDTNRLTDQTVNGTGTQNAGSIKMYANLVQNGVVIKSSEILADGSYLFLGLFTGSYEVQVSRTRGVVGQAVPAQDLPTEYEWVGDNIGALQGNDGSPNGRLAVSITMGIDVSEVNFGIDLAPVTVPLEFLSFTAIQNSNDIQLSWETANEFNNDYFSVEKALDGFNFRTIGKVMAGEPYKFLDKKESGIHTYRLKQVDIDGNFMYSKSVTITINANEGVSVYPSLVEDWVNVVVTNERWDKTKLSITNLSGSLELMTTLSSQNERLDLSRLAPGVYILQAYLPTGVLAASFKIVKI